ncbi:MAG TPA: asparagine synthase-related protein [bacterium]|nr:asparagine synthase-related protein [bacterium]
MGRPQLDVVFFGSSGAVLDHRLVEKTLALPGDQVIHRGMTKYILRQAMQGVLPEKIRQRRDKIGFDTPQDEWFRVPNFQKLAKELLESESLIGRGLIDNHKALQLYQRHLDGQINIAKEIWKWLHLEMWFREFID